MVISSRTPEGEQNRCPVCGQECRIEPSEPLRDGPCPHCGHLLWFAQSNDQLAAGRRSALVQLTEMGFGPIPPELRPAIENLVAGDVQRLLKRAVTAVSWTELLAVEGGSCYPGVSGGSEIMRR